MAKSNDSQTSQKSASIDDEARLKEALTARGVRREQWNTMCHSLYPGARPWSVLLVWDYCTARKLDPMKKPCHIVPIEVKNAQTGEYEWRDVVMPGIYELRTTAMRTGLYLGHSVPEYGPEIEFAGVKAPEWCSMTFYRFNEKANQKVEFPVKVYFAEVVVTKKDGKANARWMKAFIQMMTKCCEAAGLREAFPDEVGGTQTEEEMAGRTFDADVAERTFKMKPVTDAPVSKSLTEQPKDEILSLDGLVRQLSAAGIPEAEAMRKFDVIDLVALTPEQIKEASAWAYKVASG